jgi:NADH-quinone oxidoreductase subunit N
VRLDATGIPLLLAAGTALAALLADLILPRWRVPHTVTLIGAVATLIAVIVVPTSTSGLFCAANVRAGADCSYVFDSTAKLVASSIVALTVVTLLLMAPALGAAAAPAGETCFLLGCAMTGGVALAGAGDLITLIVTLETLTLPIYALVALHRRRMAEAADASVTFFVTSVVATAVALLGGALFYLATGTVQLRGLIRQPAVGAAPADTAGLYPLAVTGLVLLLVGLGFKVAAVPLHAWAPTTYDGAPVPVAAYLSTASKLGGVVAIVIVVRGVLPGRYWTEWLHAEQPFVTAGWTLAVLAVASLVVGTLVALRQRRAVRLLAWSSVAQAGFILAPLGGLVAVRSMAPVQDLIGASLAYAVFFVMLEAGAFAALVTMRPVAADGGTLDDLRGLGRTAPWRAMAFGFALIGLAGLPPALAGLFAKITVVAALLNVRVFWLALLVALVSVVGLAVYWRPLAALYLRAPAAVDGPVPATVVPLAVPAARPAALIALALVAVVALVLSVAPQLLYAAM